MLSLNIKHVQYVKIYLPCNFEVNLITHLGVIALFSSFFFLYNLKNENLKFRKFDEKRTITSKWVMGFTSKLHGR
jgi:hypothetical protein